ncbi:YggS family pyridoxal phosphate-dependent enzyme [Pseudonocardiaceae bacterium YIM PH 21723]|nr:YggS family pyridoxal phosphate-dependent enzyme [Pseudonocardiaceae bacterium YIM PH 21723]
MTHAGAENSTARREELAANLAEVRARIERACAAADRDPAGVTLVAVSKTWPVDDAVLLAELGVTHLAENRDQEASTKVGKFREMRPDLRVRWHMVGSLQRNKAKSAVRWADIVETVDSDRLAQALAKAAAGRPEPLDVLIQVSLDGDPARGGCPVDDLGRLADTIAEQRDLRLAGLMAVAPLGWEPTRAFDLLAGAAGPIRSAHRTAVTLSAGMSGDLEHAIAHGSTSVRVGTALFGGRRLASD